VPRALSDALERPSIVFFPRAPIPLPSEDDQRFLRDEIPARLSRKNVSFYPSANRLAGVKGDLALRTRVQRILEQHSTHVRTFLQTSMPELTRSWTVGTSSFRPLEEQGRDLSAHASNELVHVDAGAYGATHGARILRFFVNLNPTVDRVWVSKGDFASLYLRYRQQAGLGQVASLEEGPLDRLRTGLLRSAERMGVPRATMADSSPYDRAMRTFHNFLKDTPEVQRDTLNHHELRFPPFSAWMVFTCGMSHACTSGQFALVDTFLLPLQNCRIQAAAPFHVLTGAQA
jgi:hypothetical protein